MKKEEMIAKATKMLAKTKFKLKKASPTIMIAAAGIGGIATVILACKATLKAETIVKEHQEKVTAIHDVKDGNTEISDDATYTEEDMKKDLTTVYVQTGVKLVKTYAPAVTLGVISLSCMFGSHHIMSKRNASLTAAYIALDKAFNEYKGRVTARFGGRVQQELEQNIKAVEVTTVPPEGDGKEIVKEYKDIALDANDPYSMIFDESVSTWEKDPMLNRVTLDQAMKNANRKLRTNGHLFLNDVIDMIDGYGKGSHHTPIGQVVGWIYDPDDKTKHNSVDFGITNYVDGEDALNNFIDGYERSVVIHFNCDGPIIDKI